MCLGRDSNPHGRFGPRDFLATMAFATFYVRGLDYSFTVEQINLSLFRRVVSSLCTFLFSFKEAWLKITISITC